MLDNGCMTLAADIIWLIRRTFTVGFQINDGQGAFETEETNCLTQYFKTYQCKKITITNLFATISFETVSRQK